MRRLRNDHLHQEALEAIACHLSSARFTNLRHELRRVHLLGWYCQRESASHYGNRLSGEIDVDYAG
jgi:hypothetical protein